MLIKVGIAVLLALSIGLFVWFKFSPFKQVPNVIPNLPNPSQQNPSQPTSKKGLENHEMPKLLDIEIKSGVDKEDGEKMRQGFKIIDFYLNEWFGKSITRKSSIRVEATSGDSKFLDENNTVVFLYRTLSSDWQMPKQMGAKFNMDMRSRAAAHEYIHLYQINDGCAHIGREGEKVKWFLEGEAEWLSYKAFDESGNLPFFFSQGRWLSFLSQQIGGSVKPLQAYEQGNNLNDAYPYFTLAIEFLMKNRQIKTLDDFCLNLGKGQELSVAFQNAFGIPLAKFYGDFEAYFTKTYSKTVKEGAMAPSADKESQIPQGYSSWADFCKVQPKDSRCMTNKP